MPYHNFTKVVHIFLLWPSLWLAWNQTILWHVYDFNVMILKYGSLYDLFFIHPHRWLSLISMFFVWLSTRDCQNIYVSIHQFFLVLRFQNWTSRPKLWLPWLFTHFGGASLKIQCQPTIPKKIQTFMCTDFFFEKSKTWKAQVYIVK